MARWKKKKYIFHAAWMLLCLPHLLFSQVSNQTADSVKVSRANQDLTMQAMTDSLMIIGEEIELLEISIDAVVEKPRVSILPKRVEPTLGEMEFVDRSFENELKRVPDKPMITDERLFTPKKIENLRRKLLLKKRELEKK